MGAGGLYRARPAITVAAMVSIHLIDRDAATRFAARRVLEGAGFAVSEAADERAVAPAPPALVIADLSAASLAAIRREHPGVPVLALGGAGEAALLAGSLEKPFTASRLLAAVRRCLARGATTAPRRRSAPPPSRRS
ncbi:MAG TPA: hypothetical protein VG308_16055 [Stellaceae bacterium]|nr:hypothetical protein [Stellaceae bacterium]